MPVFNYPTKEVNVKVVYYGPGLSGKTTNLQRIHDGIKPEFKGKLISLATQTDRTLFFDFMPMELGSLGGYKVRLHLYTVPGQVHYNATRKLVLKGVDGVVFVADSQKAMTDANVESFLNLQKNLESYGKNLSELPHVIQANKRDLEEIVSVEDISSLLNRYDAPVTEAVAEAGSGVLETLTEIVRLVMRGLREQFAEARTGRSTAQKAARPVHESAAAPFAAEDTAEATVVPPVKGSEPVEEPPELPAAPEEGEEAMPSEAEPGDLPVPGGGDGPGPVVEPPLEAMAQDQEPAGGPPDDLPTESRAVEEGVERPQPVFVTVPVEGLGNVEITLSLTARVLEEGGARGLHVTVDRAALEARQVLLEPVALEPEPAPVQPEEPAPVSPPYEDLSPEREGLSDIDREPDAEQAFPVDALQPLGEGPEEPLGAPLDGEEEMDTLEMPDLPSFGEEGPKVLLQEDLHPQAQPVPEPEKGQYDPTAGEPDLFSEEPPDPVEEHTRKKGILGMFRKKK